MANGVPPGPEVLFYHLERATLEAVLPKLLERTLERGQRAVVQTGSDERLQALDAHLWVYEENAFLPHGTQRDGASDRQPIYLTTGDETPNSAAVRFLVDGANAASFDGLARAVFLFDGNDPDALAKARADWKRVKSKGLAATYWQQDDDGKWLKKA